jgi:hypothetical protein
VILRLLIACLLAMTPVSAVACGDDDPPSNARTLVGVVVAVDALSLENIVSFTLRSEGREYEIFLRKGAEYSFPPQHLHEHVISAAPVQVQVEDEGRRRVAVGLDDATH